MPTHYKTGVLNIIDDEEEERLDDPLRLMEQVVTVDDAVGAALKVQQQDKQVRGDRSRSRLDDIRDVSTLTSPFRLIDSTPQVF